MCPCHRGLPFSTVGKESACNAGDPGLIPGSGRFPGEGNGNPLQCFCLENPRDRLPSMGSQRVRHGLATKSPPPVTEVGCHIFGSPHEWFCCGKLPGGRDVGAMILHMSFESPHVLSFYNALLLYVCAQA